MSDVNKLIKHLRTDFELLYLDKQKISKNPISQFKIWMSNALEVNAREPNAMTLSTVNKKGQPDARIVLLRSVDKNGFIFFTNYNSVKAREIEWNKKVCLNFFWADLARQVRVMGTIEKVPAKVSDMYFQSRPRESQLGAWASSQSEKIPSRNYLEQRFTEYDKKYPGKKIPRPPHWGGYIVKPISLEFWQGRANRLHDRILFEKGSAGSWKISRLSP